MAVTQTQTLPAPFLESITKQYATGLGDIAKAPLPTAKYAPGVVKQTDLQTGATTLAGQGLPGQAGIGGYQPYLTGAGAAGVAPGAAAQGATAAGILGTAGTQLGTAETGLAGLGATYATPTVSGLGQAQTTLAGAPGVSGVQDYISAAGTGLGTAGTAMTGVSPYITGAAGLTGAGAGTGAGSVAEYMSPYQQQVIDTSLAEFDKQAAMRQQQISDAAVAMGGFGGGREGVMQSEYQLGSDKNRAMLQAQLQQQGYTQAQAARQADMASRLGIGGAQQQYAQGLAGMAQGQLGLGQATGALAQQQGALAQGYLAPGQFEAGIAGQQAGTAGQRAGLGQAQLGLGQYQMGIGQALQGMTGQDIGTMGRVGALDQAQKQAVADATREANRMAAYEPLERLGIYGTGVTGLMGGYPAQYQFTNQPNPTPLQSA
ncbi:MAG: hypothetical protein QF704_12045, partial [Anaerolineales bacterium]|nr:hypothetical protein [Anaerolineales bacterium]